MPAKFFFDLVCDEETIRDDVGVEAEDLDQALAEAQSVIVEMADAVTEAGRGQSWTLIVRGEMGSILGRLPITR